MSDLAQLPLIKSPSYGLLYNHMLEVWNLKPNDIIAMIENHMPHMLDPEYILPD